MYINVDNISDKVYDKLKDQRHCTLRKPLSALYYTVVVV